MNKEMDDDERAAMVKIPPKFGVQSSYFAPVIHVGRLNKAGTAFVNGKEEATDMVIRAVAEYVSRNFDGHMQADYSEYDVEVRVSKHPAQEDGKMEETPQYSDEMPDWEEQLRHEVLDLQDKLARSEKRLELADAAPHSAHSQSWILGNAAPCDCWKAAYEAAKETL